MSFLFVSFMISLGLVANNQGVQVLLGFKKSKFY